MNTILKTRREFLEFFGSTTLALSAAAAAPAFLTGCTTLPSDRHRSHRFIKPTDKDEVIVPKGIHQRLLLKYQDPLSPQGLQYGTNNDFTAFIAKDSRNPTDGILMVNHESVHPLFVSGHDFRSGQPKTRRQVELEQAAVGVSLVRFYQDGGTWKVDTKSPWNRRITGQTMISLASEHPIEGSRQAKGTFANCAGGQTPWGTFLTCEENYDHFYGEFDYSKSATSRKSEREYARPDLEWHRYEDCPPAHYGWVVEIDPWTGSAKKLTSLGRFAHEGAKCTMTRDGRVAVYMGDDAAGEFLYKFISDSGSSLEKGTLYVAQLETGRWLPVTMDSIPEFKSRFRNHTDLMVRTREAARALKATPLDRPEDIEINPANEDVIVALTNNSKTGNLHGSLLKIQETNRDPGSLTFQSSTWISGGPQAGLSCPDNLAFDKSGNLWVTTDISGDKMNQGPHAPFKNNGLFYIPMKGPEAGQVFQVASAPRDAEFTGPMFTPDGETLILSVQHPGEQTRDLKSPTSTWPDGGLPRSGLIALSGETLSQLVNN
jgi:secreted PhoX family phosphatase